MAPRGMPRPPVFTRQAPPALCASLRIRRGTCLPQTRNKPRGVPARCPASPLMPMNAPRGMPLRKAPAPANAPEPPPDRTHAACPFALQRPSLILSQSHVYAACPEQWPRARPSPPGPSARTPPVLRETRSKKGPAGSQPTASNAESPIKSRVRKERAAFPLARHPRSHQQTTLRAAKGTGIPGAQAHPPKGERARPSPPGPSARTPPVPREPRGKSPPGGGQPTASNARAAFSLSSPCLSRNTAANGHAPWEERAFRHQTHQLARLTLLSRAESAQPGALGMPANAKIALIYKNQVRFCFPGWRTFSTPGASLTALPRAPRCRVRG